MTGFGHANGWSLSFEFAGGRPSRHDFLARACEFVTTAADALGRGHVGSFLDNAYSATELLAKAELLSAKPTVELVLNSKKHNAVATSYHLWANLGNTELAPLLDFIRRVLRGLYAPRSAQRRAARADDRRHGGGQAGHQGPVTSAH